MKTLSYFLYLCAFCAVVSATIFAGQALSLHGTDVMAPLAVFILLAGPVQKWVISAIVLLLLGVICGNAAKLSKARRTSEEMGGLDEADKLNSVKGLGTWVIRLGLGYAALAALIESLRTYRGWNMSGLSFSDLGSASTFVPWHTSLSAAIPGLLACILGFWFMRRAT